MKTTVMTIAIAVLLTAGTANAAEGWTLDKCIEYAIENNIQIRQSDIAAQSREVDYNTARNNRLPGVSAGASQGWSFGRSITADNTYANTNTASTSFNIGTDVTLFAGRRITNNIQWAELSLGLRFGFVLFPLQIPKSLVVNEMIMIATILRLSAK